MDIFELASVNGRFGNYVRRAREKLKLGWSDEDILGYLRSHNAPTPELVLASAKKGSIKTNNGKRPQQIGFVANVVRGRAVSQDDGWKKYQPTKNVRIYIREDTTALESANVELDDLRQFKSRFIKIAHLSDDQITAISVLFPRK